MGLLGNSIRVVPSHSIPCDISRGIPIPMDIPAKSTTVYEAALRVEKPSRAANINFSHRLKHRTVSAVQQNKLQTILF